MCPLAYGFDTAYRLTSETRTGDNAYAINWTYDDVGNRLTQVKDGVSTSSTYNARNQLATATTGTVQKSYSYDNNGNNVHVGTYDGGVLTGEVNMAYDVLNRQTYWGDGTSTETHSYAGAEWHRVSTTVNSSNTVHYIYDGDNVVADSDGTNLTKLYVTPFLDQNVAMYDVTNPAAISKHYYSQDGLGSVRTLTDASGTVENSYDYTAFGESYAPTTSVTVPQRYQFTGREMSSVSDLQSNRFRYYANSTGRWTARDPIGHRGNKFGNLYLYADNRVNIRRDPFGLEAYEPHQYWAVRCPGGCWNGGVLSGHSYEIGLGIGYSGSEVTVKCAKKAK